MRLCSKVAQLGNAMPRPNGEVKIKMIISLPLCSKLQIYDDYFYICVFFAIRALLVQRLSKAVPDMDGRSSLPVWGRRASSPGKFLKLRASEMGLVAVCGQVSVL